jgi:DHA2 family multidrug resistance protein-like MFS transporter
VFTDPAGGLAVPMVGFILAMFGNGPLGALVIDLVVGSAPKGRAGSASSLAETGGEFGSALGVAALGSVAAAVYAGVLDGPGDTVEATAAAAENLPPAEAAGLLDASRDAFTAGLNAVSGVGAALVAGLAVVALVALRHVGPTRNNDHEMELEKTSG